MNRGVDAVGAIEGGRAIAFSDFVCPEDGGESDAGCDCAFIAVIAPGFTA